MWEVAKRPRVLEAIVADTEQLRFPMASEPKTGSLLRLLAASKPCARVLEIGTGTGISAAWLLEGMDDASTLVSIDNDAQCQEVARKHLGNNPRVTFICQEGEEFLKSVQSQRFEVVFADSWPGKFSALELALKVVAKGGYYIIDDLLPQTNWPAGHAPRVSQLVSELERQQSFVSLKLEWASGLMVLVRVR
ncbi:MAG: class I SAM-dependent methyltransferase [Deltaproteobacteria bacterium]|nr:class I SAM-dependent methyltransferase [Deltaproteobacteria bacterium]